MMNNGRTREVEDFTHEPPADPKTLVAVAAYAPVIRNLEMPLANKEYSYQFPAHTKKFLVQMRAAVDVRIAFVKDVVADSQPPYFTLKANISYSEDELDTQGDFHIYLAHSEITGQVAEILAWR